jgi:triacylglycerol esterase/lipase EstA (alpha/beta hydrolase family)
MLKRCAVLATVSIFVAAGVASGKEPALTVAKPKLRAALACDRSLAHTRKDPVLLIHGTFADSAINWSWNYAKALPTTGRRVCWVDLPDKAAGDIQVSSQYVVSAIRQMAQRSHRQVAIISHSQGGLEARWALRWWPSLRPKVSDAILLVSPNHGAIYPDTACVLPNSCAASLYQMMSSSRFLAALDRGGDAIGKVPFTSVATRADKVFVGPDQAAFKPAGPTTRNFVLQDLCPADAAQHNDLPFDGPAYQIALDALDHRGPASAKRLRSAGICKDDTMPGVSRAYAEMRLAAYTGTLIGLLGPTGPKAAGEPPVARYAR